MLCNTSCKHSLALLRIGEIIAPSHVELIEIINEIIIVASSWLFILLHLLILRRNSIFRLVISFVQGILLYVCSIASFVTSKSGPIF